MNKEIYEETFAIYKNLMFYDEFKPQYVYFSSLKNYDGTTDEYKNARDYVVAGIDKGRMNFFSSSTSQPSIFEKGTNNIKTGNFMKCIKFVKQAINYETQNELTFFNQKLKELQTNFSDKELQEVPEVKQLMDMFNSSKQLKGYSSTMEEIIDYDKFLSVVNSLLQGIEKTKAVVKYEQKRLTQIDQALQSMLDKRQRQLTGLAAVQGKDQNWIDQHMKDYQNEIDAYYLKNKNFSSKRDKNGKVYESLRGATTAMRNIPKTVAVELANWINKQLSSIFSNQELVKEIMEYVQEKAIITPNYQNQLAFMIKGIIAQSLVTEANINLERIINRQYRNIPKKKIIDELEKVISISQSYNIEGFYPSWATTGQHLKGFNNLDENFNLWDASAEGMMALFKRLVKAIKKSDKEKYNLSDEQEKLKQYLKENDIDQDFKEILEILEKLRRLNKELEKYEKNIQNGLINKSGTKQVKLSTKKESLILNIQITPQGVIIDDLEQKIKSLKAFQNLFGENSNMKMSSLKNTITTITSNASKAFRDRLAESVDKAVEKVAFDEQNALRLQLNTMIRDGLQQLKVGVRGPDLSEVLTNIDFKINDKGEIINAATGRRLILNDSIIISVDSQELHFKTEIETLADNSTKQLSDIIITSTSDDQIEEQLQYNVIKAFHDVTTEGFTKHASDQDNRFTEKAKVFLDQYAHLQERKENIHKEYKQILSDWKLYEEHLRENGLDEKTIANKYKQIIETLKNSFYISTTVKTYNQYYDKIGFSGGSLGGTLDNQLSNISDMFKLAGMPISQDDIRWLKFLIINCGSQMYMGEDQRPQLEQYLGSLAAFMLFDEGGAEARILAKLPEDVAVTKATPKILHLYNVNGIYITGSYVLKQVLETLEASVDIIQQNDFHGAGIRIINNMSENMISNRNGTITSTTPWQDVADKANKNVSLEIFFLAGLLNVVNKINTQMANIALPN